MSDTRATRFEPPASEVTQPFWDATRDERLLVQRCVPCDQPIFYPREVCPSCLGTDLTWVEASGAGTIYAVSVQHQPANPMMAGRVPYVVALVDLPEGIRMMTNVVGCEPDDATIGSPVTVCWEPLTDGRNLPQFQLTATRASV